MMMKELVAEVNHDLKELRDEASRHGENPRLIRILDNLIRLTNIEQIESGTEKIVTQNPMPESSETLPGEKGNSQHFHVANIYGNCACGQCMHVYCDENGVCKNCNIKARIEIPDPECKHWEFDKDGNCVNCGEHLSTVLYH